MYGLKPVPFDRPFSLGLRMISDARPGLGRFILLLSQGSRPPLADYTHGLFSMGPSGIDFPLGPTSPRG